MKKYSLKTVISIILVAILVFTAAIIPVNAQGPNPGGDNNINTLNLILTYPCTIRVVLLYAHCGCSVTLAEPADIDMTLTLQKETEYGFVDVESWSLQTYGDTASISEGRAINPTLCYRVKFECTAGDESILDFAYYNFTPSD